MTTVITPMSMALRVAAGTAAVAQLARAVDGGAVRLDCQGLPEELRAVADELEEASRGQLRGRLPLHGVPAAGLRRRRMSGTI